MNKIFDKLFNTGILKEVYLFSIFILLMHIYFKYTYLRFGGLDIATKALGLEHLTVLGYMSFYAKEIFEALIFFPVILIGLGIFLQTKLRCLVYLLFSEAVILFGIACWTTYHTIGIFPSFELISDFFVTIKTDPNTVAPFSVLTKRHIIKSFAILSLGPIAYWMCKSVVLDSIIAKLKTAVQVVIILMIVLSGFILLYSGKEASTVYHAGTFFRTSSELFRRSNISFPNNCFWSASELKKMYEDLVFPIPVENEKSNEFEIKKLKEYHKPNIIFIILETAAYQDYSFTDPNTKMKNIRKLSHNSFISENHYSSYPYSIRANFSLLASVYDLPTKKMMVEYLKDENPQQMDSLPRLLKEQGYITQYYYPRSLTHRDEMWMLKYLGFEKVIETTVLLDDNGEKVANDDERINREVAMFERISNDIEQLSMNDTPYFLAIATAIGHGPYPDTLHYKTGKKRQNPTRDELVSDLAEFMDDLIGLIIGRLEKLGLLHETIIMITGDHGVRSKVDDSRMDLRFLNEQSFHVPLLIYCPMTLKNRVIVSQVTSHVDIVPTVLSLIGENREYYLHQGLPLFDGRIEDRITFVLGGHYFGSNGFYYNNKFYMINYISNVELLSDKFEFNIENILRESNKFIDNKGIKRFSEIIPKFIEIQMAWASCFKAKK